MLREFALTIFQNALSVTANMVWVRLGGNKLPNLHNEDDDDNYS